MDATDEQHDLADDDDAVVAHRDRAKRMLNEIAQQTKQALIDANIDTPVFFLVPRSGDAIVTFGTITDPPDDQWSRVSEVVASVVQQSIGLDRIRFREVMCASTDSVVVPLPAPAAQPAEVDR